MTIPPITSLAEFKRIMGSGKPVIIEFWAEWCQPCQDIDPVFEALAQGVVGVQSGIEFYKVHIAAQREICEELDVHLTPTFILFESGKNVGEITGADPEGILKLMRQIHGPVS